MPTHRPADHAQLPDIGSVKDQHIDRLEEDGRDIRTIDTYRYCAKLLAKIIAGVRVGEATPARIDAAIRSMRRAHGDVMAVQSKTLLKGGLHLAVTANVVGANPVRDVSPIRSKTRPKGATALTADDLRGLLAKLRASEACQRHDLVDPITLLIATGLRISELLGLEWPISMKLPPR
jgi:integrase